jgi:hypothetical protein
VVAQIASLERSLARQGVLHAEVPLNVVRVAVRTEEGVGDAAADLGERTASRAQRQVITLASGSVSRIRVVEQRVDGYLVVEAGDELGLALDALVSHAARGASGLQV